MPRTYTQTVTAAQMLSIAPTVDMAAGTMAVSSRYVVGSYDPVAGTFSLIPGAANAASASVTVPLNTSLADANTQLQLAIAQQEGLDLSQSVQSVMVTAGGSGYVSPTVTFSPPQLPGGVTATGTVTLTGDVVTGVTVTEPGSGYLVSAMVTFTDGGGPGAGAMGTATMLVGDRVLAPAS
jgi:hypothetical protein